VGKDERLGDESLEPNVRRLGPKEGRVEVRTNRGDDVGIDLSQTFED
jgi:hypothetical protein